MTDAPMAPDLTPDLTLSPLIRAATLSMVLLVGGLGGASAIIPIDGAVVAQGQLLVPGKPLPVQSLEPGVVARVAVRNGQAVQAGDLLLSLDQTLAQAQLDIAMQGLAAALTEEARFVAEARGGISAGTEPDFTLPALPFAPPDITAAATRQRALFAARQTQAHAAQTQAAGTEAQLAAQIGGVAAEISATTDEMALLRDDLIRQTALVEKGLARHAPMNDLQRQQAALTGRLASLGAETLRLKGAQAEARARLAQDDSRRAEDVAQGLRDTAADIQSLTAQIATLNAALLRTDLRAPVAGIVHELAVTAPGAVIAPGTTLVQIVPTDRALEIEVAVDPRNIDRVHPGQMAEVMIASFDPRAVPRLPAHVTNIPPGAVTDANTGRSFYRVSLTLDPQSLPDGIELLPGMPVEAFLSTGVRPLLSWLIAPLIDPMARALREE
jgi:HlyD family type I secretion membrane fusion protein